MNTDILITDKQGTPRAWSDLMTAACYYARDKVVWEVGSHVHTFIGGKNEHGEVSQIDVHSILGVSGPIFGKEFYERETVYAERSILYKRDHEICAYCGNLFSPRQLTIDHVLPRSRGGKNTWTNTVTACKPCNVRKADRTPEEAKMHLLYLPYSPSIFDKMILQNRNILADQMDFLMVRASKNLKTRFDQIKCLN